MSSEENNFERQSEIISYSLCSQSCTLMPVSSKPGTIKLSASVADCICTKATTPEFPKLCQFTCYHKPVSCPIPDSVTPSVEICNCKEVEEDMTPPVMTCESEEEGTHEHKCCFTPCCEHNSQGVQPSEQPSSASCSDCYAKACSSPLPPKLQKPHIEPRLKDHVPKSVEELKASITGLTGLEQKLPPGNLLGCQYIDYRCQISNSLPCSPTDSQTDSQASFTSCTPPRYGFSLTIEPKDHRFCTNPNECKHSREFCPPPECPPPCPPRLPEPPMWPGPPEPVCPPPSKPVCPPPPEPVCPPPPEPVCPPPSKPVCPAPPKPVCPAPPKPVCPAPPKPVCPAPPKPVCPRPPKPVCPPPSKPVCPPPPKPLCPGPPKPVCPPPPKPVCPGPPKPVCPPPPKPVCPPPPKPVCPPPPKPVCPPPPKPVCRAPPKPVCPAPPKPVCPAPPKPVCPGPRKPVCPGPRKPVCPGPPKPVCPGPPKPVCPPPPCPPTPPECPEPDCSPPPSPKRPKRSCGGGCEQCFLRR